ncbi:MAG TPA: hypothetical protein VKA30_12650, partial [Actinomycetota bacterium]|nr:hypothetical protein [Actinomycetota bacterium]
MPSASDAGSGVARRDGTAIGVACVAIAAFYALAFGVRHIQVPVADDSFFYVWAVRFAGVAGLADSHLAARPAFPLVGSTLGAVSGASPWLVAVALPITMAVGLALVGASIATRWGLRTWGLALFVTLAAGSAVVARLVAGKTENLLTLWMIAGVVAVAVWARGRPRLVGIAVLSFAAGLSEWPFLAAFLGLVAGLVVVRPFAARWIDFPSDEGALTSMLWSGGAGFVAALAVVSVWNGTQLGSVIQALPSDFAYRSRFRIEVALMWPALTFPLAVVGWWVARRGPDGRAWMLHWLFGLWLAATGVILLVGWAGVRLPTYRALTFALPIALAAAAAPFVVRGLVQSSPARRRAAGWILGVALA